MQPEAVCLLGLMVAGCGLTVAVNGASTGFSRAGEASRSMLQRDYGC
jgi:hypothetical protein